MLKPRKNVQLLHAHYDRESRILIVDNDEIIAKFFKIHLNKFFSKVFVTSSAKDAIEMFRKEAFDLIISESNLPRVSGHHFVRRIRKMDAKVPIILMTGLNLDQGQSESLEADGLLRKPFTIEDFHDCLRQGLLEKDRFAKFSWLHEEDTEDRSKKKHPTKRNAA